MIGVIGKVGAFILRGVTGEAVSPVRETRSERLSTRSRPAKATDSTEALLLEDLTPLDDEALDVERGQELNIVPDVDIPDNWAILHVSEPQRGHLKLYGIHRSMLHGKIPQLRQQQIGLAEFVDSKVPAKSIFESVNRFSREVVPQELHLWLRKVVRQSPEAVFIIVEHTETCIPWELVRLEEGYLGTHAEIVRWTTVRYYHRSVCMTPREELHSGSVASFVTLKNTAAEKDELRELSHKALSNGAELLDFLEEADLSSVGLIYLACHGVLRYGHKTSTLYRTLGSLTNPSRGFVDLDLEDLKRRGEALPVFVVNACHSGRLHRDEGGGLHGFPKEFLAYVARAYVGTLGPVGDPYASEIGARILRRIRECGEGIYLSRLLREMREEASKGISYRKSPEKAQLRMLYTFMYVYYGNPLLRLKVQRPEQE